MIKLIKHACVRTDIYKSADAPKNRKGKSFSEKFYVSKQKNYFMEEG